MKDIETNKICKKLVELNPKFANGTIYTKEEKYWKKREMKEFKELVSGLFDEHEQFFLATSRIEEAIKRASNVPQNQIKFNEEEHLINLENGIYDVQQGILLERTDDVDFSYVMQFEFDDGATLENAPNFLKFVGSVFPDDTEKKTKLLLQALGYGLSAYTTGKCGFFFIGKSNSGKSTLLEVFMMVIPEEVITAIPLHRLSNRFNLARLDGAKVNVCMEISENSLTALDMFKMMVSNEKVTAEHKNEKPFNFRIKCKSFNAGNMLPAIDKLEGMDAIINRMVILLFPVGIPKEEQDLQLKEKLFAERNVIFSLALNELYDLQQNNFIFVEPDDSRQVKEQMLAKAKVFDDFIDENYISDPEGRVHMTSMYDQFVNYCEVNFCDVKISKSQFAQRVYGMSGVKRKKVRIDGSKPLWGVEGLKMKNNLYYNSQDSDL